MKINIQMINLQRSKIRSFIKKERLYVWLLIFIISVTAAIALTGDEKLPQFLGGKGGKISYDAGDTAHKEIKYNLSREGAIKVIEGNKRLKIAMMLLSGLVLFAIAAGIFLDFMILIVKKEGRPLLPQTMSHKDPPWGIWSAVRIIILFVWLNYMLMLAEAGLSKVFPWIRTGENLCAVLNATITDVLALVFIIYFVAREYREKVISLGFSLKNFFQNILCGISGYLAAGPLLLMVLLLTVWVSALLKYEPPIQPVLEIFFEEKKKALVMYLTVFVAVFGPIVEETFFRAFMYRAVKKRYGFKTALFSTSAFFALLHTNLAGFLPIMILGMLLAYLFEKTGTIVASCAVHILHNTVMLTLVFAAKEIIR